MMQSNHISPLSKPTVHAQLSVMLAVFKANRFVELLTGLNFILLLVAMAYAQQALIKGIALLGAFACIAVFYYALRVRIDQALFERWDSLDVQALDAALLKINTRFEAGKTLAQRLAGAYRLFRLGLYGLILQFIVLLSIAWFFVQPI